MSIFVNDDTRVLVQGITGREASEKVPEMIEYGTDVAAGVTPGKGGQEVSGVPVYDTVREAVSEHPGIDTSLIYVPPFAAKDAVLEAMENDIDTINIITERMPTRDSWKIRMEAEKREVDVVGPTSVGIISPDKCKLGPIGGDDPESVYRQGNIGVISKSGGMTTETSWVIRQAGYGISTAVDIGGDVIAGTSFADALEMFEDDEQTDAVVMFGELGGTYEEKAAELLEANGFTKPLITYITGEFTESMPSRQYGHAGAIIRGNRGKPSHKKKMLKDAGAEVVDVHHRIGERLDEVL